MEGALDLSFDRLLMMMMMMMKHVLYLEMPAPVAARSKASICGRSPVEIVCSNPGGVKDVCLL